MTFLKKAAAGAGKSTAGIINFIASAASAVTRFVIRQAVGLTTLVGGAIAWFNTPAFVGGMGVVKSLGVGVGTSVGGAVGAFAGFLVGGFAGAAIGGTLGLAIGRSAKGLLIGAAIGGGTGAIGCAVAGDVVGMVKGYKFTKQYILKADATSATSFNKAATQKNTYVLAGLPAKTLTAMPQR